MAGGKAVEPMAIACAEGQPLVERHLHGATLPGQLFGQAGPLGLELTPAIKDLAAAIRAVQDVDTLLTVHADVVRQLELPRAFAGLAPRDAPLAGR